jgi:hypothetical protein
MQEALTASNIGKRLILKFENPLRASILRSDVLPSEELAGNAAPIVGAYAVIP